MFEMFNLADNAFPVTPGEQQDTPWFGFKGLKREFDNLFQRSSSEAPRLCVLNRGRLGAGKTHAARYYSQKLLSRRGGGGIYGAFIPIVIESPKQPQKAFIDFSSRLLNAITFRRIAKASQNLQELIGRDALFERLLSSVGSEDIATLLSNIDENNLLLSKAFLLGGGTAKELRELGLAKRLTVDHEFALAIIGVFTLLVTGGSNKHESLSRIVLWVDEMEDLVYFPTRYYLPFVQALREIIDNTTLHFTLMVNFTFSEPEELPAIENVLGQAIMQRINQHVVFKDPSAEDLHGYLIELLQHNRLNDRESSATFPFSNEAFQRVVRASTSRTPRFLNKLCDSLLREIHQEWSSSSNKQREISAKVVEDKLPQLLELLDESRGG